MVPSHTKHKENGEENGEDRKHSCSISSLEWERHKQESMTTVAKLTLMEDVLASIADHFSHLKKLDKLDVIADGLIGPATGRNQVPVMVVMTMMSFMGAILILILVNNTQKTIKMNWKDGLVIENGNTVRLPPDTQVEIK